MSDQPFYEIHEIPTRYLDSSIERVESNPDDDVYLTFYEMGMDYLTALNIVKVDRTTSRATLVRIYDRGNEVGRLAVVHRMIALTGGKCDHFTATLACETMNLVNSDRQLRRLYDAGNEAVKLGVVMRFIALREKCDASATALALELARTAKDEATLYGLGKIADPEVQNVALERLLEIQHLPTLINIAPPPSDGDYEDLTNLATDQEPKAGEELTAAARAAVLIVETSDGLRPTGPVIDPIPAMPPVMVDDEYADFAASLGAPVHTGSALAYLGPVRTPKGYDFGTIEMKVVGPSAEPLVTAAPEKRPSGFEIRGDDMDELERSFEAQATRWAENILRSENPSPEELHGVMTRLVLRNTPMPTKAAELLLDGINDYRWEFVSEEIEDAVSTKFPGKITPRKIRQNRMHFTKSYGRGTLNGASASEGEMVSTPAQREEILRRIRR